MTQDQIDLLKTQIAKGCTDDELKLFIQVCKRTSLDPFAKQIYAVKMGGKMSIQVSIDGLRLIAERSGKYRGQVGPHYCGTDGEWFEVWLKDGPPIACKVGVLHKDFDQPLFAICKFSAYAQDNHMWKKMPEQMIAKVAESLALRKAFPQDLSGIYSSEEMEQALPAPQRPITPQLNTSPVEAGYKEEPPFEAEQFELSASSGQVTISNQQEWEGYQIPFGQWKGKTIREVGITKCLDKVKWFDDEAKKTGKPITGPVLKFKETVNQAVLMGMT